jgi:hypothetical protein
MCACRAGTGGVGVKRAIDFRLGLLLEGSTVPSSKAARLADRRQHDPRISKPKRRYKTTQNPRPRSHDKARDHAEFVTSSTSPQQCQFRGDESPRLDRQRAVFFSVRTHCPIGRSTSVTSLVRDSVENSLQRRAGVHLPRSLSRRAPVAAELQSHTHAKGRRCMCKRLIWVEGDDFTGWCCAYNRVAQEILEKHNCAARPTTTANPVFSLDWLMPPGCGKEAPRQWLQCLSPAPGPKHRSKDLRRAIPERDTAAGSRTRKEKSPGWALAAIPKGN